MLMKQAEHELGEPLSEGRAHLRRFQQQDLNLFRKTLVGEDLGQPTNDRQSPTAQWNLSNRPALKLWVERIFETLESSYAIEQIRMIDLGPVVVVTGIP